MAKKRVRKAQRAEVKQKAKTIQKKKPRVCG